MKFHNVRSLGLLAAFTLLGLNPGQAQSSGSIPAHISGGDAQFTPDITVSSPAMGANGAMTNTTIVFPLVPIPGHPGVAVVTQSPAFIAIGSFFFPISPKSRPAKTNDFDLLGGVSVSYPQDGINLSFTEFRVDTTGNVFARFSVNGKSIGGKEIELLTAAPAETAPTPDPTQFTLVVKEQISSNFAQIINGLFHATVLAPGQQAATLNLDAQVAN
jgi:hypothetical protein